jgi:hypothetical protein
MYRKNSQWGIEIVDFGLTNSKLKGLEDRIKIDMEACFKRLKKSNPKIKALDIVDIKKNGNQAEVYYAIITHNI